MTPREFLNHLWQYKPEDQYVLIWTLPDKRSRWFTSIPEAADFVASVNGDRDVYVGVGLAGKDYGPARRCVSGEVAGITGIGCDFDLLSVAHPSKSLPKTIEEALLILPPTMRPTITIFTGNGLHCWWLLKEPYIFENPEDREDVARTFARWHTMLRLRAAAQGWAYERLADLARILRIPGTRNYKDPANPKDVVVHSFTDARYNLADFAEYLDDTAIPDLEAQEKAAREWSERFADKPLVIAAAARIPQDILDGWMALDLRFKNTWLRQRHDLKDQSQSGYDLALADFGMDTGIPEQQIVDLIVHHRANFGQKARTRLDYFQRTIAKAAKQSEWRNTPPMPVAAAPTAAATAQEGASGAPNGGSAPATSTPDPAVARGLLCDQISTVLGVRVLRLVKLTGKEPTYHMELPEGKIEFPNVGKLISQDALRLALAAQVGKLITKIKPKLWEQVAQAMLDACVVDEGGEEGEWEGAARMYISQYLSETGFIDSIEKQMVQDQRKPMVIDGRIAICASDLQIYIVRSLLQTVSVKAVGSMCKALGAKHVRIRGAKHKEQSRWSLPLEEFDPEDYPRTGQQERIHAEQ